MERRMVGGLLLMCGVLAMSNPASAQNPCDEVGPGCRVMTQAEVQAFKQLVLAVGNALPVPDTTRYVSSGAAEAATMPFVAETRIPEAVSICRAYPAGSFPESPYNTVSFGYDAKAKPKKAGSGEKDPLAAIQEMMSPFENRIEVTVWLLPHPYLVYHEDAKSVDFNEPEAVNIERSPDFLSWDANDGTIFEMILGPRTVKEEDTLIQEKPSRAFAPVTAIEVSITGPKAEVAALKKKIDRKAFEAFLGPVVK
jgi:hypothetical protein